MFRMQLKACVLVTSFASYEVLKTCVRKVILAAHIQSSEQSEQSKTRIEGHAQTGFHENVG